MSAPSEAPAALTATVLELEESRTRAEDAQGVAVPDDLLPGVGAAPMPLREALGAGGIATVGVLTLIAAFEQLDRVAMQVLGPDIQHSLGVSDATLAGLVSLGGVFLVLATLPFASLGDRMSRTRVLGGAMALWSLFVLATGRVTNAFQMGVVRAGTGLGGAAPIPLSPAVLADAYPIPARGRILALNYAGQPVGQVAGTFLAGGIAAVAGGSDGWRWAFAGIALPALLVAAAAAVLRDPTRGRNERRELPIAPEPGPQAGVRLSTVFARLRKVRSFHFLALGVGVFGFALVAVPLQTSQLLEDGYGYGPFTRGWILAIGAGGSIVAIAAGGAVADRLFRRQPAAPLVAAGALTIAFGAVLTAGLRFSPAAVFVGFYTVAVALQAGAFVVAAPIVAATVPYRIRAYAFSMIGVYVFLMGGFFGALLAGAFSDRWGERTALTIIVLPVALAGGLLMVYGARFVRGDIAHAVDELREERLEHQRMRDRPETVPVLAVHGLDVSYGPVQVLFGIDLEVRRGEVLALLGTNGAGKSTLLRAISGLIPSDRGVVRLDGRSITLTDPDRRVAMGIVHVPGGSGTFPGLTVDEHLELWSPRDRRARRDRRAAVLETFPVLGARLHDRAGDLSGGQQQMLGLARALLAEPQVLLVDELSLGLAPAVVHQLLGVVEALRARHVTMVVVEQSVNLALSIADRAVFLERGRVRFEGPAGDLRGRDDLLRAVFLSGRG